MLLALIVNFVDRQKTGRYDILPGGTEEVESWSQRRHLGRVNRAEDRGGFP